MVTVTKLNTGSYEIIEGIAEPVYVSEIGIDTIGGQIVLTNKCGSATTKPYGPSDWTVVCEGVSTETGFSTNLEVVKSLDDLCIGFGKVCATGTTPTAPTIYGSNLNLITSNALFTTTSNTTVETVFSEDTDLIEDGQYEIVVDYFWNGNNIRQDIEVFFLIDLIGVGIRDNGLIHKQEPKDASGNWNGTGSLQQYQYSKSFYYTKSTGGNSALPIDLNFRTTGNNSRSSIWGASVKIFRIS